MSEVPKENAQRTTPWSIYTGRSSDVQNSAWGSNGVDTTVHQKNLEKLKIEYTIPVSESMQIFDNLHNKGEVEKAINEQETTHFRKNELLLEKNPPSSEINNQKR